MVRWIVGNIPGWLLLLGLLVLVAGGAVLIQKIVRRKFPKLAVGTRVRFVESEGEKGPQASTVILTETKRVARTAKAR